VSQRRRPALLLLVLACASSGCQGSRGDTLGTGARAGRAAPSPAQGLPPGWGRLRPLLERGEGFAASGDHAALLALAPALKDEGLSLLTSNMPNTLARHHVPRFLEGRAAFGDALLLFAAAHEQGRAADLPALLARLAGAWQGWMSVLTGQAPERAV